MLFCYNDKIEIKQYRTFNLGNVTCVITNNSNFSFIETFLLILDIIFCVFNKCN